MDACLYASDLSDTEWALLEPLVPRSHPAGRRQTYPLRRIVDAIFYLLRTGAQWRLLPHEYPPRYAVFYHYAQWREDGTWEHVTQALRESYRRAIGRAPQPTAAIIDRWGVAAWRPLSPDPVERPDRNVQSTRAIRRVAMTHYAGLDVSVRTTSVCIIDEAGKILRETRVPTEPAAIIGVLTEVNVPFHRIGLEAGPLSQWLFGALIEAGLPAICVETRHMKAALAAQVNKTDRNDARGIARMMRVGLYRPVHVKTRSSQEKRTLLASRKLLQDQIRVLENHIRGSLRTFGLKVGLTSAGGFEGRVRELIETYPRLSTVMVPLLAARAALRAQFAVLHRELLAHVRSDPICPRLMSVPGVGPIVALTFQATIDQPQRFTRSRAVGAHLGLTPRHYSSGETDYVGRISKCGDAMLRSVLYEAAHTLLTHTRSWSSLKAWGVRIAARRGLPKATVAVARKLAVILHRMWVDGTEFRWRATADLA